MIVVKLKGGLGNQMFQYAAGRALAIRTGTELLLDTGVFTDSYDREYGLDKFRIKARVAKELELAPWPKWQRKPCELLQRAGIQMRWYRELHLGFDPKWPLLGDDTYIEGYFQSEKYFSDIKNVLVEDFNLSASISSKNLELSERIIRSESVMLHVRRGDYVSSPKAAEKHGACGLEYYSRAVELIKSSVVNPKFFVFSDDLDWAKSNLSLTNDPVFVDGNQSNPEVDIHLMALGKHYVIANSSFSWWGAWLSRSEKNVVIAPSPWFAETSSVDQAIYSSKWKLIKKY